MSAGSPVVYEVHLEVDAGVAEAYAAWLDGHVRAILALPGFLRAEWLEDAESGPTGPRWVVRYHLRDRAALEHYLAEHAPAMRADGLARFGGRFTATRRVLALRRAFAS